MDYRTIHTLEREEFVIFYVDLSNATEEEFCKKILEMEEKGMASTVPFGIINRTNQLFITPKMRQTSSKIGANLKKNNLFVGISIYGGFNSFVTVVAKFAFSEMNFGKTLKECVGILEVLYEKKMK